MKTPSILLTSVAAAGWMIQAAGPAAVPTTNVIIELTLDADAAQYACTNFGPPGIAGRGGLMTEDSVAPDGSPATRVWGMNDGTLWGFNSPAADVLVLGNQIQGIPVPPEAIGRPYLLSFEVYFPPNHNVPDLSPSVSWIADVDENCLIGLGPNIPGEPEEGPNRVETFYWGSQGQIDYGPDGAGKWQQFVSPPGIIPAVDATGTEPVRQAQLKLTVFTGEGMIGVPLSEFWIRNFRLAYIVNPPMQVTRVGRTGDQLEIQVEYGPANGYINLLSSDDLMAPPEDWVTNQVSVALSETGSVTLTEPIGAGTRFFRIVTTEPVVTPTVVFDFSNAPIGGNWSGMVEQTVSGLTIVGTSLFSIKREPGHEAEYQGAFWFPLGGTPSSGSFQVHKGDRSSPVIRFKLRSIKCESPNGDMALYGELDGVEQWSLLPIGAGSPETGWPPAYTNATTGSFDLPIDTVRIYQNGETWENRFDDVVIEPILE